MTDDREEERWKEITIQLSLLSVPVIYCPKQLGEEGACLASKLQSVLEGLQGRNSRQELAWSSKDLGGVLLPDLLPGLLTSSYLSYTSQDYMSRGGAVHSGLVPFTSIINQENAPKTFFQSSMIKLVTQLMVYSSDNTIVSS